jgi:transcription elongation factor
VNRGLAAAWLTGLGVLTWREVREFRRPVPPGRYALASGVFVLLGLLATSDAAAPAAVLAAWGFDLAVMLQPGFFPGTATPAQRAQGGGGGERKR